MTDRRRQLVRVAARHALRAAVAVAAVAIMACHDSSDTRVTVQYAPRTGTGVVGFLASLQAGQTIETFVAPADSTPVPVFEMKTPASGFVVVTAVLVDSLGTIGGGSTAIALRRDAPIGVTVQIDSLNPANLCAECLGSKPFALSPRRQRGVADSIWMVWTATSAGSSITK